MDDDGDPQSIAEDARRQLLSSVARAGRWLNDQARPPNHLEWAQAERDATVLDRAEIAARQSDKLLQPEAPAAKPPLPEKEVKRWISDPLNRADETSEQALWEAIREAYPKHHIPRARFRRVLKEVRPPLKQGRRKKA